MSLSSLVLGCNRQAKECNEATKEYNRVATSDDPYAIRVAIDKVTRACATSPEQLKAMNDSLKAKEAELERLTKRSAIAQPSAASTVAPWIACAPAVAQYAADSWPNDPKAQKAILKGWSAGCRAVVLQKVCARDCTFEADAYVEAAESPEERRAAVEVRLAANTRAVEVGQSLLARTRKIAAYATSIAGTARSPSPECMTRMRRDHAEINAIKVENEGAPISLALSMSTPLNLLLGCLDCANDRSTCGEWREDFKNADERLAELRAAIARDRKILALPAPPQPSPK